MTRPAIETDHMSEAEFARFATRAARPRPLGYRAALQWIIDNDDIQWLDDDAEHISPSVTAVFAADIFDRDIDKVTADLQRLKERQ